ncbi:protein kinase [Microcoleus sp. LEGE 07076]|uniref:WD40 repeat domain-containing serine/threonine-protein kinase n=1 Tax=Microcoleus sp. LEGE 07076 TaxID=915322 RepID=UPI00187ED0D5|nr:WD40 repeat domain-containing serine/threonine-protein kinase [Microcoleus sp. LEGE 07076]MBE9185812.1 protein kinase [Microcoleus sp. LEGE 07076]
MSYCLNPHCHKPQNPDSSQFCLACGSKLLLKERYRALQPIGEGTFGRTFLAVDEDRLKTRCAIKQFFPQVQEKAELEKATALFKQEAHRLYELGEHPQIPSLLASFEQGTHLYLVEELIEGNNLFQELQQRGAFSEEQIWELLINLLPVLQFVHEQQVIHRDIKPENILRRTPQTFSTLGNGKKGISLAESATVQGKARGGQFVLVDFGVAKHVSAISEAKTGTITGTAGYAPIEQIRSGKAYPASDLYSLGVTCIHLLTGAVLNDLFDALECKWIWRSHLAQKGIKVSKKLTSILNKLLKDSVRERYQSAAEVLQELVNFGQYPRSQIAYNYRPKIAISSAVTNLQKSRSTAVSFAPPQNIQVAAAASNPKLFFNEWRCARILRGHSGSVNAVVISPQGNIIASASDDKTIKLWNLHTGELIHTFFGHSATVDAVAISPDGRMMVSGSFDRKVIEWKLDKKAMIREFYSDYGSPYSHRYGSVYSVAFSCDGGAIASASGDKSIKLWNQHKGALVQKLSGHSDKVLSVSFRPQSMMLASGSADKTIKIWRVGIAESVRTLVGHSDWVYAIAFSQDGKTIISGSADTAVKLWNVDTGELINTLRGHSDAVISVAISPDRSIVASGSRDGTVKLWNLQTGVCLCSLVGCNPVAFSPDGQTLVTGGDDGEVLVWRAFV